MARNGQLLNRHLKNIKLMQPQNNVVDRLKYVPHDLIAWISLWNDNIFLKRYLFL